MYENLPNKISHISFLKIQEKRNRFENFSFVLFAKRILILRNNFIGENSSTTRNNQRCFNKMVQCVMLWKQYLDRQESPEKQIILSRVS
jgi:hypothetical protein